MKQFKQYIKEMTEDPDDYYDHDSGDSDDHIKRAGVLLTHMYDHIYNESKPQIQHIEQPHRFVALPLPSYNINDKSGNISRMYGWHSWHKPLNSAAFSMASLSHGVGALTGFIGDKNMEMEERNSHIKRITDRIMPFVENFEGQHRTLTKILHDHSPEFREVTRPFLEGGLSLDHISDAHLYSYFGKLMQGHQVGAIHSIGDFTENRSSHDRLQDLFSKENNRAVTLHGHPLGLVFEGGPVISQKNIGRNSADIIKEPHPTTGNLVDVTHRFVRSK